METFFVRGRARPTFSSLDRGELQNRKTLAAVVFGMVQARRRQTIRGKGQLHNYAEDANNWNLTLLTFFSVSGYPGFCNYKAWKGCKLSQV
jgi:hypothetical protein